jgi:hypothetical protein
MARRRKIAYAALLVALLCAGIGGFAARAWHGEAPWHAAVSATREPTQVADPDYVQGLAKRGIVNLPGVRASATRSH